LNKKDDYIPASMKFKKELFLDVNNFIKPVERDDVVALAQVIQNLLIYEKGTFPNQPNLGIGISNYLFEFGDDQGIMELESEINRQINNFIDVFNINVQIDIKLIPNTKNKNINTLSIRFLISRKFMGEKISEEQEDTTYFTIYASGDKTNKKLLTKLIYS